MSKPPDDPLPPPPDGVKLSHVPALTAEAAVDWYLDNFDLWVTARWLRDQVDAENLTCRIICGKRHFSTQELYRFIVTRPARTARRRATA